MKMSNFDWSIVAFALAGGVLLSNFAEVPFLLGASMSMFAWLLHPLFKMLHRLTRMTFGSRETLLFFNLARSARRDEIRREDFATLASIYEFDFKAEGIEQVRKYRRLIEDMNDHLARFPDKKVGLKATYLRRGLRDLARSMDIEPTNATRQFDFAMAEVHAHEFKRPSKLRKITDRIFSRAFGTAN